MIHICKFGFSEQIPQWSESHTSYELSSLSVCNYITIEKVIQLIL